MYYYYLVYNYLLKYFFCSFLEKMCLIKGRKALCSTMASSLSCYWSVAYPIRYGKKINGLLITNYSIYK